jgi:transcriptional regulator with XRE-family HTH domain
MNKWATRIRQLQETGLTLAKIGEEIGLSTSSVSDIANGYSDSPRGDAALALDKLHRDICGALATPAT